MIDITQHQLYSPAPAWTYERAWAMALRLYPRCHDPAVYEAILILLDFCRRFEDGTATANNYGDAATVVEDVKGGAA